MGQKELAQRNGSELANIRQQSLSEVKSTIGNVKKGFVENTKLRKLIDKVRKDTKLNLARLGKNEPVLWMSKQQVIDRRARNFLQKYHTTADRVKFSRSEIKNYNDETIDYNDKNTINNLSAIKDLGSRNGSYCQNTCSSFYKGNIFNLHQDMLQMLNKSQDNELILNDLETDKDYIVNKNDLSTFMLDDDIKLENKLLKCEIENRSNSTFKSRHKPLEANQNAPLFRFPNNPFCNHCNKKNVEFLSGKQYLPAKEVGRSNVILSKHQFLNKLGKGTLHIKNSPDQHLGSYLKKMILEKRKSIHSFDYNLAKDVNTTYIQRKLKNRLNLSKSQY